MIGFAYERVRSGLEMPGLVVVHRVCSIGEAIDDIVLVAGESFDGAREGQVIHLPLDKSWQVREDEPAYAATA